MINDDEVAQLVELGAVGRLQGGHTIATEFCCNGGTNSRVASVPLEQPDQRLIIRVAGGVKKAEAILAAGRGKLLSGLIVDEAAAQAILAKI